MILVVDDDPDILDSLAEVLRWDGYEVTTADDGSSALSYLQSGERLPSLIVLDLMMPKMDGAAFRREQLRDPVLAAIPVIVVSAVADVPGGTETLGANAVLAKPLDLKKLRALVRRFERSSP